MECHLQVGRPEGLIEIGSLGDGCGTRLIRKHMRIKLHTVTKLGHRGTSFVVVSEGVSILSLLLNLIGGSFIVLSKVFNHHCILYIAGKLLVVGDELRNSNRMRGTPEFEAQLKIFLAGMLGATPLRISVDIELNRRVEGLIEVLYFHVTEPILFRELFECDLG
jgi:hypothetical protein